MNLSSYSFSMETGFSDIPLSYLAEVGILEKWVREPAGLFNNLK